MTGLGRGIFLFLLWMCLLPSVNSNFYSDILCGQCYAFCLTRHEFRSQQQVTSGDIQQGTKEEFTIKECRRDRICKSCLDVCKRPKNKYLDNESCRSDCKDIKARGKRSEARLACREGCNFIQQSTISKYGSCPSESNFTGVSGMCSEQCKRDLECDRMDKCCSNGCGTICHSPTETDVFPPKPGELQFKVHRDGGVVVRWGKRPTGEYIKPVTYVLRWWCPKIKGVRYTATTRLRYKVKGLRPAISCKFMVAATNVHGSLGFSDPLPYKKKLLKPSLPLNLEEVKNKRRKGDKVDVTIRWDPPLYLDGLPLMRYLVLWSDGLPDVSPEYHRLRMNKKTVRNDRNSATIPGLKEGTTYFIQVKAVVKWSGRPINGQPVSMYITTDSSPQTAGLDEPVDPMVGVPQSNVYNITMEEPVFIRTRLKAKVTWSVKPDSHVEKYMLYWTPDICDEEAQHRKARVRSTMEATTHKQEFIVYNLKSNCLYELRLYTVSYYGEKDSGLKHLFQTPLCHNTKGSEGAKCPPKVMPPSPPAKLSARFKLSANCMCQAVISWDWSEADGKAPKQFSVIWGPSRQPGDSQLGHIVYQTDPYIIHIPGSDKEACVTYLEPSHHYTVKVVSHANKLKSQPAVKHFSTPSNMARCGNPDDLLWQDSGDEKTHAPGPEGREGNDVNNQKAVRYVDGSSRGHHLSHVRPHLLIFLLLPTAAVFVMNVITDRL